MVGLGIMRLDKDNCSSIIQKAFDLGIRYYEGCFFYLDGECENLLAKGLLGIDRKDYLLGDKLPVYNFIFNKNMDNYKDFFDKQLQKFNTNYFDNYLLQALDRKSYEYVSSSGVMDYFLKKKDEGKILNLGFSFHDTPEILEKYLSLYQWDFVQLQLNYYDWYLGCGKELYSVCENFDVPIYVMGPLKGGTLTHNLPNEAKGLMVEYNFENSIGSWGIRFLRDLPNIELILTGATQEEELIDVINSTKMPHLNEDEHDILKKVINIYASKNFVNCTACNYCKTVCSQGVPIKEIFYLYNLALDKKSNVEQLLLLDNYIKGDNGISRCLNCKKCEQICPQKIKITQMFKKVFQQRL